MISRVSVGVLLLALAVLAGLQYRWIGQISVTERQRLERSVQQSASRFVDDFSAELSYLATSLQLFDVPVDSIAIYSRFLNWRDNAAHPDLVRNLHVVRPSPSGAMELLPVGDQPFEPIPWPADL